MIAVEFSMNKVDYFSAFENDTRRKCDDILKKYNKSIVLQFKDIITTFILFVSRS